MRGQHPKRAAPTSDMRWILGIGIGGGLAGSWINDLAGPRAAGLFAAVVFGGLSYRKTREQEMPPALALLAAALMGTLVGGVVWLFDL